MSMAYYEETIGRNSVYEKLVEARSDVAAGRVKPLRKVLSKHRTKLQRPRLAELGYQKAVAQAYILVYEIRRGCTGRSRPSVLPRIRELLQQTLIAPTASRPLP